CSRGIPVRELSRARISVKSRAFRLSPRRDHTDRSYDTRAGVGVTEPPVERADVVRRVKAMARTMSAAANATRVVSLSSPTTVPSRRAMIGFANAYVLAAAGVVSRKSHV